MHANRSVEQGRPVAEPLEPRVLFSADPAPIVGIAIANLDSQHVAVQSAMPSASELETQHGQANRELVVIDSRVADAQFLIDDLEQQRVAGRAIQWIVVQSDADGIDAVTQALEAGGDYAAVHLVAHGEPGRTELGASVIDLASLRGRADQYGRWAQSLSDSADLLLYGCDIAADQNGEQLIQSLAELTGADVAASKDLTGSSLRGGNWALEAQTGSIELAIAFSSKAQEQWAGELNVVPTGAEHGVNAPSGNLQELVAGGGSNQAALIPGTGAVVVWLEQVGGGMTQINGRIVDMAGNPITPVGADFAITPGTSEVAQPAVAYDAATNRIIVSWTDPSIDGDGTGIAAAIFDLTGTQVVGPFLVNHQEADNLQSASAITSDGNGKAFITWTDRVDAPVVGRGDVIRGRQIDMLTIGLADEQIFDSNIAGWDGFVASNSAIAFANSGDGLVVWQTDTNTNSDGDKAGVFGRFVDSAGNPVGIARRLNQTTTSDQTNPSVATDGLGNYVVAFVDASTNDIRFVRLNSAGVIAGSEAIANAVHTGSVSDPTVSMNTDGSFVIAWQSHNQTPDNSNTGVFIRNFNASGLPQGVERLINESTPGKQESPTVLLNGSSGLAVWSGNGVGDSNGIYARAFDLIDPAIVSTLIGSSNTQESGSTTTLSYRLNTEPTAPVTLTITSSDASEGNPLIGTLTFNAANWMTAQVVTIQSQDDSIVDGIKAYNIVATATSGDALYNALAPVLVSLNSIDDDSVNELIVDTLADTVDDDVSSIDALVSHSLGGSDGKISLREAILATNATANGAGGVDRIYFHSGLLGGVINVIGTALPQIQQAVMIDAEYGFTPSVNRAISIAQGSAAGHGLELALNSDGSTIRGLSITGFSGSGIAVRTSNNTIIANHIGVNAAGNAASGNSQAGLLIDGGGLSAADNLVNQNVISGNGQDGVVVANADDTVVENNLIGVNQAATGTLNNVQEGINIWNSRNTQIQGNIIGGNNGGGIRLQAGGGTTSGTVIRGNAIGTDFSGTYALGNSAGGIAFEAGVFDNIIGGTLVGEGNLIANSASGPGIFLFGSPSAGDNAILGNRLINNQFGISLMDGPLAAPSPRPNDPQDVDAGANDGQNYPVLANALLDSGVIQITGTLNSSPNSQYRIEFFASSVGNSIGDSHGEAQIFLGAITGPTDNVGDLDFSTSFAPQSAVTGWVISATATQVGTVSISLPFGFHGTSEFAKNVVLIDNLPPVALDDSDVLNEDAVLDFSPVANDYDPGGGPLQVTHIDGNVIAIATPITLASGTLVVNADNTMRFTPTLNYNGPVSFVYTVTDQSGAADTAKVDLTVLPLNDPPAAAPDFQAAAEDIAVNFDVRTNDFDADGDPLVVSQINGAAIAIGGSVNVADGSVTLNADGSLSFAPSLNFFGGTTFSYQVSDGQFGVANSLVNVNVASVNDSPVVSTANLATAQDTPMRFGIVDYASDVDGGPLFVSEINGIPVNVGSEVTTGNGSVRVDAADRLIFIPTLSYTGTASFNYQVADGQGGFSSGQVNFNVTPVNHAPVAIDDTGLAIEDSAINLDLVANDTDSDGDFLAVTQIDGVSFDSTSSIMLAHGVVSRNADGSLLFSPAQDFFGSQSFSYTVTDTSGASATGLVMITVQAANDAPILVRAEPYSLGSGETETVSSLSLQSSDVDNEPSELVYTLSAVPSELSVKLDGQSLAAGQNFTQADVDAGRVQITRLTTSDSVVTLPLSLSDQLTGASLAVDIKVSGVVVIGAGGGSNLGSGGSASGGATQTAGASSAATNNVTTSATTSTSADPQALPPNAGSDRPGNGNDTAAKAVPFQVQSANASERRATAIGNERRREDIESQNSAQFSARAEEIRRKELMLLHRRDESLPHLQSVRQDSALRIETLRTARRVTLSESLNQLREQGKQRVQLDQSFAASSVAVGASVSIGYVVWLLRGGVLLSSMLATIPAWAIFDPLPVLSSLKGSDGQTGGEDEDDSLESMLKRASQKSAPVELPKSDTSYSRTIREQAASSRE